MAIKRRFAAQEILKPGVYSQTRVDNSGGTGTASNDTVFSFRRSYWRVSWSLCGS